MLTSLYIHVPFCRARCTYCDFVAYAHRETDIATYAEQLAREIAHWARQTAAVPVRIATVFFGGGTPSLAPAATLGALVRQLRAAFPFAAPVEQTLEANPSSTTPERLAAWRASGFNRLSLGVQSFDNATLRMLGRLHGPDGARRAVRAARAAGFDNLNLDLIYGLPGQDLDAWGRELEAALELEPEHVSLYCLSIEPGTALARQVEAGVLQVPDDDTTAAHYELAEQRLAAAGYEHYEISNWAQPGYACRHNLVYWRNGEFLGLGPGAWSHWRGQRFGVVGDLDAYLLASFDADQPALIPGLHLADDGPDRPQPWRETAMLRLRLAEGLDLDQFAAEWGHRARDEIETSLAGLASAGLYRIDRSVVRLTARGRLLSNEVFLRILGK